MDKELREIICKLSELDGFIRGAFPNLPTKEFVHTAIEKHEQKCPNKNASRNNKLLTGAIAALASSIAATVAYLVG